MKHRQEEHERQILHEAFLAGWQAALGVYVTSPRALAIIDTCFEQWLGEAADEAEVLGLMFRGRYDLPGSLLKTSTPQPSPPETSPPRPSPAQASPAPTSPSRTSPPKTSPLPVELTYGKNPHPVEQPEPYANGRTTDVETSRRERA
jgi:hypothetical protein